MGGAACGAPSTSEPTVPVEVPQAKAARDRALARVGRRLFDALRRGAPERLLFDDGVLRRLLEPDAATRVAAYRLGRGARLDYRPAAFGGLRQSEYAGVCLQGARVEPSGTPLGLRKPGWVFDRALVAATTGSGRRLGAWVEGTFVYTNAGFGAIDLGRVEEPRWEHSDLELAPCDMEVGLDEPLPVVDVTK
jgi:hypothetical protein